MRKNLKEIARRIKEKELTLDEAEREYWLNPSSKSKVKHYLQNSVEDLESKTEIEKEDELEENLKRFLFLQARKAPKPKKFVTIKGKRYQDITGEFIDCGG